MTTELRPSERGAGARMSPLELRLYVVALLAAFYAVSWRAIGGHGAATDPPIAVAPPITVAPTTRQPQGVVWLDRLPLGLRPAITLPAGWQLASESQRATAPSERVVRVPTRRVPRVRTRSS